jgi:hypothetical protein
MKKIILWSAVSVLIAGIAVASIWWLRRPQVITLKDGSKLTLLGVEYGKHHKFPTVKTTGRRVGGGPNSFDTTNDTLVVWILNEHKGNQWGNFQVLAYDKEATACVTSQFSNSRQIKTGTELMGVRLDAFPRRGRKIYLGIMSYGPRGQQVSTSKFVISNPVRGKTFSNWTPDPLPDTQSDDDLEVTLTQLVADAPSPYNRGTGAPKNDPINKIVQIDFDAQQKGQSVTNWRPVQVETTDATGNYVKGWINPNYQNGQASGYFYQPGLWPNEPAWKVRLEFSRTAGFSDDELWSVTNIPVHAGTQQDAQSYWIWNNPMNRGQSKAAFAETTINGVHVKLFPAIQYSGQNPGMGGNGKVVSVTLNTDPDPETSGMRMTPLTVTDDQGHVLNNQGASWGGGNYQYQFAEPRNIESLNVTIALHKSRFVEFTVKPQKAAANSP